MRPHTTARTRTTKSLRTHEGQYREAYTDRGSEGEQTSAAGTTRAPNDCNTTEITTLTAAGASARARLAPSTLRPPQLLLRRPTGCSSPRSASPTTTRCTGRATISRATLSTRARTQRTQTLASSRVTQKGDGTRSRLTASASSTFSRASSSHGRRSARRSSTASSA